MSEYKWEFDISRSNLECSGSLIEDYIRILLVSLLDHVVLTFENTEVKIDGFRYVKDRDDGNATMKLHNKDGDSNG